MQTPTQLIGIYDADSTLLGEISYWIGARLGRRHCSLCELTHGTFTMKNEWKSCATNLRVPFATYHRNDAPSDALAVAAGTFPTVLARYSDGLQVVLNPVELSEFNGDTIAFVNALQSFLNVD
jgi:hypothetical protein